MLYKNVFGLEFETGQFLFSEIYKKFSTLGQIREGITIHVCNVLKEDLKICVRGHAVLQFFL